MCNLMVINHLSVNNVANERDAIQQTMSLAAKENDRSQTQQTCSSRPTEDLALSPKETKRKGKPTWASCSRITPDASSSSRIGSRDRTAADSASSSRSSGHELVDAAEASSKQKIGKHLQTKTEREINGKHQRGCITTKKHRKK